MLSLFHALFLFYEEICLIFRFFCDKMSLKRKKELQKRDFSSILQFVL